MEQLTPKPYPGDPVVDEALALAHGLTREEWRRVLHILGRTPTFTELGIFSVMWSEHCSYKSSRVHLKKFPTTAPWVLQGPGENAGAVDIGGGYAAVFKMESHNHPSFVEPYQGAATGVGGIMRDVFTMNARPVANLNSLRFGDVKNPRTAYLVSGVVAGIGGYGNCVGIPTVGGEVFFDSSYNGNILVNAFTLGVVRADRIFRARASGTGNPVIYVGSRTGRDGIHGASLLASAEFKEDSEEKRPTVQVGDPFTEKLLLEACLEVMEGDAVVAIQDMGAAGLTSSSVEMAGRGGCGIVLHLDRVPRREEGMTPYETMLSESQERMLLVVQKGREREVLRVFEKWDLDAVVVGEVVDDGFLTLKVGDLVTARLPALAVSEEAPLYERPMREPDYLKAAHAARFDSLPDVADASAVLEKLLASPNLACKKWVWRQYDHSVRGNTVEGPGGDAAVIRLKENGRALAMSCDVNARYCYLHPRLGAMHAVAEAARNLACVGAKPLGLTDCLNFGSPENPGIMWQFAQCVEGMAEACHAFDVPVVSGNVSFYNETSGQAIFPAPAVAMVGILEDPEKRAGSRFIRAEDTICLLGPAEGATLGGSEYLQQRHGRCEGMPPALDLALEKKVQALCREAIAKGLLHSAHDCADGGIAVALAECGFGPEGRLLGADVELPASGRLDETLFGEAASRILVSLDEKNISVLEKMAGEAGVPFLRLGRVTEERLRISVGGKPALDASIQTLHKVWSGGFEKAVFGC